jgi:putative ABC transport system permease protein
VPYSLADYAFRVDIGIDLFIVPVIILLIISILTVGHRIYITAKANPVDSLRAE